MEFGPALSQPDRHPFKTQWSLDGPLDDVTLRFFWDEPVQKEARKNFEETFLNKAEELIEQNWIHYVEDSFKWRTRSRKKGQPKDTPLAHKAEIYGDFVTLKDAKNDLEAIEPFHQLLDVLHDIKPPITLVKISIGE